MVTVGNYLEYNVILRNYCIYVKFIFVVSGLNAGFLSNLFAVVDKMCSFLSTTVNKMDKIDYICTKNGQRYAKYIS